MKTLKQALHGEDDGIPFLIAEMSGNHNASLERALTIVDAAADAGADALKIQTFTPDTMTLDLKTEAFLVTKKDSAWFGRTLYELFTEAQTPYEWHRPIIERAKENGILCFSSAFDESGVELLESLEVPAYKIASFENVDLPLIRLVAETGKPVIISTGMASLGEIEDAVETALAAGCRSLTILKCTSSYPASPESTNLRTIPHMAELFDVPVGLSDHTFGIGASIAATAFGASAIEKHFTLRRADGGVDSQFSLEPEEFALMVRETRTAAAALGQVHYGVTDSERHARSKRRSLYIGADMRAGEILTPANLRRIRPGEGLPPKYYETLLGRRVGRDLAKGTPVSWDIFWPE